MLWRLLFMLLIAVLALPSIAVAQHSDIEFEYQAGKIHVDDHSGLPGTIDGTRVFESDFPTSGPSQNFTISPGFESAGGIVPFDEIWIGFLMSPTFGGALQYHDGASFAATAASITIEDNSPGTSDLIIDSAGFNGDNPQFLATADSNGDIHSHISFELSTGAAQGAYGILLNLQSNDPNIENSDPFWIVFNHGLDASLFDNTVLPAFGAVPEPGHGILLLIGSTMWLAGHRRRKA